jgi:putative endonuclease
LGKGSAARSQRIPSALERQRLGEGERNQLTARPRNGARRLRRGSRLTYNGAVKLSDAWFVYILRCGDDSLYTGIARDVTARIAAHASGRGARYTRSRGPFTLCKTRRCTSKGSALSLEHAIKRLSRAEKEHLLEGQRLGRFARALAGNVASRASRQR